MRKLVSLAWLGLFLAGCGPSAKNPPTASPVVPVATSTAPKPAAKNDSAEDAELGIVPVISASSVHSLELRFNAAMSRDKQDRNGPSVKRLVDSIVLPLVQACTEDNVDPETRSKIIYLLFYTQDLRAAPCFVKTLQKYVPEENDGDVGIAARAVGVLKLKDAAEPLFKVFNNLHPGKPKGALAYRDVHESVLALSDPSWEMPCALTLAMPIRDRKDIETLKLEAFRQVTCAGVLGRLRSVTAVPNLARILLSPLKSDVQSTAINALIRIGKPAIPELVTILRGTDKAYVEYAKQEYVRSNTDEAGKVSARAVKEASRAYLNPAAVMLGSIGHGDAAAPMLEVLKNADPIDKVIIARELLKLPHTPTNVDAVKRVYEKTPLDLTIPPGMGGRSALLEQFSYTFDAQLIPWLVKDTLAQKGDDDDLEELRGNAFVLAMKLAKFDQLAELDKIARLPASGGSTIGKGYEKEFKLTKNLLSECRDELECYFVKLGNPDSHIGNQQFVSIKAMYMIGVLGGPDARAKLIELLPKILGDAARFVAVQIIDHFSPKGDPAIARQLQQLYDDAVATKNPGKQAEVSYFPQFIGRLEARAQ